MKYDYSFYNIILKETDEFTYLFNSLSGALCKLENKIHNQILKNIINDTDKCQYFDELLKQGFIKPIFKNEYNQILINERQAVLSTKLTKLSYVIAPTLACNLNCDYCFESGYRTNNYLSDNLVENVADFILKNINKSVKEIHLGWFGGEPLLAFNQIVKFNKYFRNKIKDLNVIYTSSMITNGVLLTEEKIKFLVENCNLKNIQITIDGTQEIYCQRKKATSEQFYQLLKNIKTASKYIKVTIRLNCDKGNFEDLKEVAKHIIDICENNSILTIYLAKIIDYLECGQPHFFNQLDFDKKRIEFDKYISGLLNKPYKKRIMNYHPTFCNLFKLNNLVIGPQGELYKCEHHVGQKDKEIGNIAYGYKYSNFMMNFIKNEPREVCKGCKIFPLCLGGCPAQKFDLPNQESCFYSEFYIKHILENYI